jgi:3-hydroxymyristoyl/3-hydroxydecanoyl-(acyl carrier protein) dehydratase
MASFYDLARLLPHAPPFRLIDRLVEVDLAAGRLVAERRLTRDDLLLRGAPLLPPTLVIEALCQAAACLNGLEAEHAQRGQKQHRGYLVSISDFRFPGCARGGDTLLLAVQREGGLGRMQSFAATAQVAATEIAGGEGRGGRRRLRSIAGGRLLFAVAMA